MGKGGWMAPLLLLVLLLRVAAADLSTHYSDSGHLLLLSSNRSGQSNDIGYVSVRDEEDLLRPCHLSASDENCYEIYESITSVLHGGRASDCFHLNITSNSTSGMVMYCTCYCDSHLYGGPGQYNQSWPIEYDVYDHYSYVTKQEDNVGIAERYWLFSDGTYIYVPPYVPLFIDQNTNESEDSLCLIAENKPPYPVDRKDMVMELYVCDFDDAEEAHEDAAENFLGKPSGIPDERMVTYPIWSTWARYKRDIDEATVREFASEILSHGFNNSQIEIDDMWEICYGSLTFDSEKFPNITDLVDDLHALGFRVTLWVHPFVNLDCEPYHTEALDSGYFVNNTDGYANTTWWNGEAGIIDFTNPEAAAWWAGRLRALRNETGIDSFKFDAGETSWLPQLPDIEPRRLNPVQFSAEYLQTASQFGSMIEVRVGQQSQYLPAFVRMLDKDSRWGFDNGLASLVTTLLQMNMVGYPFVLPDMVGGNGYGSEAPTKELFIRWLQATVFMPAIQFSYVPWDFDDEALEICRNLTDLHTQYAPRILELMQKAVEDGTPVNLPLWWLDPTDETALAINSEFLLGEDLLVAPVLEEGAVSRDIYLPRGSWRDEADPEHPTVDGPAWLANYSAPLSVLPYFTRVDSA
ncbi:myogenesis-regulating glycosidase-like [Schistocerca americana]|uniref:myogenesis-regulating glycosidase-like n=1 Tax=Schistocerca americana TaxID=7009 RepID=UPI001F4F63D0|nr:myogenesis-regulating glycosidase-like [Schistocerca americana]